MDVRLPDGTVIQNVPDDISKEQLVQKLKANGYDTSGLNTEKPGLGERLWGMVKESSGAPIAGGPMGAIIGEANKKISSLIDRAAYGAGGAVTDVLANKVPPEAAGAAGYVTNVGVQAIPMILSGEMAKAVASSPMQSTGRWLMKSATKPTLEQLKTGKAARAIETMLKEGVSPTAGGVDILKSRVADLNDEIAAAIKNSNAMVDKRKVASYLHDALKKFETSVNPSSDTKAIEAAWTEFMSHPLLSGNNIPVQLAQTMKQSTYKTLGEKAYGEMKGASMEAQKTLARGLKEEISKAVPEVAALNKRESDLINALKVAERRALMDQNKNPLGLGILNPATLPVWLWDRSAWAKALTGRMLYSGSEQLPALAARTAVMPILMESGRPPALAQEY